MNIEDKFREQLGPNYDRSGKPTVYFFDYAVRVSDGDRPKFENAVYISKRSKTAHNNQDFHRKMLEEDKAEFPAEWEHYLKVKDNLSKPRIGLLPGIDIATRHEMRAVGIYNLEQLVAQDDFVEWIDMARRILNVTSQICESQRQAVQGNDSEPPFGILGGGRGGEENEIPETQEVTLGETRSQESWQQEEGGFQEKSIPKENITFEYEMTL